MQAPTLSSETSAIDFERKYSHEEDGEVNLEVVDKLDVKATVKFVLEHNYKRVAIQLPDNLLKYSLSLIHELQDECKKQFKMNVDEENPIFYLLADTTFGSCCPDYIAAQHVNADLIVHYGDACRPTSVVDEKVNLLKIPTYYVYGKKNIDIKLVSKTVLTNIWTLILSLEDGHIINNITLYLDVDLFYVVDEIKTCLDEGLKSNNITLSCSLTLGDPRLNGSSKHLSSINFDYLNNHIPKESTKLGPQSDDDKRISIYIGPDNLYLNHLSLELNGCSAFFWVDTNTPNDCLNVNSRIGRTVMRRYGLVQRVREANVFGILVGTLSTEHYQELINVLMKLFRTFGKKFYTLSVGKPNVAKLANFMDIEAFILIACPENSLLDSKEFLSPIITPFELEYVFKSTDEWSSHYGGDYATLINDFNTLIKEQDFKNEETKLKIKDDDYSDEEPEFSLYSGKYIRKVNNDFNETEDDNFDDPELSVTKKSESSLLKSKFSSPAADYLNLKRTYKGLDTNEEGFLDISEGRSGIAKGYENEK